MFSFFAKKKIKAAFLHNKREHAFLNLENISAVLILFSYSDMSLVQQIAKHLESKGIKATLWTVILNGKEYDKYMSQTKNNGELKILSRKDLTKSGLPKSSVMDDFAKLNYDTLIDLTVKSEDAISYLLGNNSARFCIGIKNQNQNLNPYDFILHSEQDNDLLETFDQIKNYLSNIH